MAHDESEQKSDQSARSEDSGHASAGPITITTSDPAIESSVEHVSDWKLHPDSTLSIETTQEHEANPLYVVGVRKVIHDDQQSQSSEEPEEEDKSRGKSKQPGEGNRPGHSEDHENGGEGRHDRDQEKSQPSLMKNLLMTACIAIVSGLIGASGYLYFAGSGGNDKSEQAHRKGAEKSGSNKSSKDAGGGDIKHGKLDLERKERGPSGRIRC